jgi:hypothetical protein
LRKLALGVVPVAGLLAQSARSMRQSDFAALCLLAELDRAVRERMLLSTDRFLQAGEPPALTRESRASLLERFGLFGIRLGVVLIRGGIREPTALAQDLARHSGLDELLDLVGRQFLSRAADLKARTALVGMEALLRSGPRAGSGKLEASLERLQANAHGFTELRLLATLRTTGVPLSDELAEEAEMLIGGGRGMSPQARLGLPTDASWDQVSAEALRYLNRWRAVSENPLTDRGGTAVCRVVIRSCEGILSECSALQPNL